MATLKRKLDTAGCEETESSDPENEVVRAPPPKKKHKPFTLFQKNPSSSVQPALSSKSKPFVTKQGLKTPAVAQQPEAGSTAPNPSTPRDTPANKVKPRPKKLISADDGPSSLPESSIIPKRKGDAGFMRGSSDDEIAHPSTIAARAPVHVERELNDLCTGIETLEARVNGRLSSLEDRQTQSEKQHATTIDKLNEILGHLRRWAPNPDSVPPTSSAPQVPTPANIDEDDLEADPELYEVCRKADRDGPLSTLTNKAL